MSTGDKLVRPFSIMTQKGCGDRIYTYLPRIPNSKFVVFIILFLKFRKAEGEVTICFNVLCRVYCYTRRLHRDIHGRLRAEAPWAEAQGGCSVRPHFQYCLPVMLWPTLSTWVRKCQNGRHYNPLFQQVRRHTLISCLTTKQALKMGRSDDSI